MNPLGQLDYLCEFLSKGIKLKTVRLKKFNSKMEEEVTCKNSCRSAVVHGGEPESQAENDLGPHGEGDSIV